MESTVSVVPDVQEFPAVDRFCESNELFSFLNQSIELAREVFSVAGDITLRLEKDPEAGDEYILINVPSTGTAEEIFQGQRKHTRLTRGFPDSARSRLRLAIDPV